MAGGPAHIVIAEQTGAKGGGRQFVVRLVVGLSFVAALWFIVGDSERRSSVAAIGIDGAASLFGMAVLGSTLVAGSWAVVAGRHVGVSDAFREYLTYQPSKYLPGGVAQGLLQMSHVRVGVGSWGRASGVFAVHMGVLVFGGGLVSLPALLDRFPVPMVLLAYSIGACLVVIILRVSGRFGFSRVVLPPVPTVLVALMLAASGLAVWGIAYSGALAAIVGGDIELGGVSVFGAGWLTGYLALPIPAGIGVREAALAALSDQPSSLVVAASVVVRLAVAAAEVALAAVALFRGRNRWGGGR